MITLKELENLEIGDIIVVFDDNEHLPKGEYEVARFMRCSQSGTDIYECCKVCKGYVYFDKIYSINRCLGRSVKPYVKFDRIIKKHSFLDDEFESLLDIL